MNIPKRQPLMYWCQKVLPLVYDDSLSYYELLNKVVAYLNNTIDDLKKLQAETSKNTQDISELATAFVELRNEITQEISRMVTEQTPIVIGELVSSGQFYDMVVQAIDNLDPRISNCEDSIEDIEGDIITINHTLDSYHTGITQATVKATVDENAIKSLLVGTIDGFKQETEFNSPRCVVWIGDSYVSAGSLGADVDKRFSTLVSHALGLTEKNYGVGGSGYVTGTTYAQQVANAVDDFDNNSLDKTAVPYVFVCGCRNDSADIASANDYYTAVANTYNGIVTNFPNAQIVVLPVLWDYRFMDRKYLRHTYIIKECARYEENVCKKISIIDNCYTWLTGMANHILYENGSTVHPDVIGHRALATHLISALRGKNYCKSSWTRIYPTTLGNVTDFYCDISYENNEITIFCKFRALSDFISTNIFSYTAETLAIEALYFGQYDGWTSYPNHYNAYRTEAIARNPNVANGKCTLACRVDKTGTSEGSITIALYAYSQFKENEEYTMELKIPYGVIDRLESVS